LIFLDYYNRQNFRMVVVGLWCLTPLFQ